MLVDIKPETPLLHYTSTAGLLGILKSNCLWATHFGYMNDSQEVFAAQKMLHEVLGASLHKRLAAMKVNGQLPGSLSGIDTRKEARIEAERHVDVIYEAMLNLFEPYILSFYLCDPTEDPSSYQNGALRHWSSYGKSGGFAIEFNAEELGTLCTNENKTVANAGFFIAPVSYQMSLSENQQIRKDLEVIIKFSRSVLDREIADLPIEQELIDGTMAPVARILASTKNSHFRDEREARVVIYRPAKREQGKADPDVHPVHFRENSGLPVPYIELFKGVGAPLPIKRIIIGPHTENDLRLRSLQLALDESGIEAEVHVSDIPYIER